MERFVSVVTGGGIALVVGLWFVRVFAFGSLPWVLGLGLILLGAGGLAGGIRSQLV